MSVKDEFKAFVMKGNVVDLAIAVVIGTAFAKIVTAFVDGIVMPMVSYVLPSGDWQAWTLGKIKIGSVLGATVDFVIIAFVVFLVLVKLLGSLMKKEEAAPTTKECPACLELVAIKATRCRHCTSQL